MEEYILKIEKKYKAKSREDALEDFISDVARNNFSIKEVK